jgi:hypothetical protein
MYWLAERLYGDDSLQRRRRPFFGELWRRHDIGADDVDTVAPPVLPIVS